MENFVVFILDENGEYFSTDGQNRFRMLTGIEAYEYRFSEEGKRRNYAEHTIGNCTVLFEVKSKTIKKIEATENHGRYIRRWKAIIGYEEVSANALVEDNETETELIETIADSTIDVEEEVVRNMQIDSLRKALSSLLPQERCLIQCIFLSKKPISGRRCGKIMGIPQSTIDSRLHAIYKKIKKFL